MGQARARLTDSGRESGGDKAVCLGVLYCRRPLSKKLKRRRFKSANTTSVVYKVMKFGTCCMGQGSERALVSSTGSASHVPNVLHSPPVHLRLACDTMPFMSQ